MLKTILVRLALIFGALPALAAQDYQGAWFTISYPDGFTAVPGLPSSTADGHDSARFRDPSGRVEFYVYSPQAGGTADFSLSHRASLVRALRRAPFRMVAMDAMEPFGAERETGAGAGPVVSGGLYARE